MDCSVCHEEEKVLGRPAKPSVLFAGLGLVCGSTGCTNCPLFGPEETRYVPPKQDTICQTEQQTENIDLKT
jgi:hypothetical protein